MIEEAESEGKDLTPEEGAHVDLMAKFAEEIQAGTITRNSKGRFVPGNPGGPGRPKKLTYEIFWETVKKHATPEAIDEMIQAAFEAAKCGDAKARDAIVKLLASLNNFEHGEQERERREAQERIDVQYAELLKPGPSAFQPIDFDSPGPSLAEKLFEKLKQIER